MNPADQLRSWFWRCYGAHLRTFGVYGFRNDQYYCIDKNGRHFDEDCFLDGIQLVCMALTLDFVSMDEANEFISSHLSGRIDVPFPTKQFGKFLVHIPNVGEYARDWVWSQEFNLPPAKPTDQALSDAELCLTLMKSLKARANSSDFEALIRHAYKALEKMM